MTKTFTATTSAGKVYTRTSKSFDFAFCVAYVGTNEVPAWTTDRAKAERVAASMRKTAAKSDCMVSGAAVEILEAEAA